jgi:hypothetical protein
MPALVVCYILENIFYISVFRRRIFRFQNPKTVQIFIPVRTPTTEKFHSAISILCQTFSYNCNFCYDTGGLIEEVPLIAVCPISSRFEPDIDFAIYGIQSKFIKIFCFQIPMKFKGVSVKKLLNLFLKWVIVIEEPKHISFNVVCLSVLLIICYW